MSQLTVQSTQLNTMSKLSPFAHAVLNVLIAKWEADPYEMDVVAIAAVIRATAKQAHPKAHIEDIDYVHQSYVDGWKDALDVILAIADELEAL
jgi:hypothetical protein